MRDPRAYLVRIVTRQALNRLRTLSRQREDYVGEWLPEPLFTSPDVADDVELAESVSIAMLTVLETLGPTERAVFVLREVFDVPYDEIAEAVGSAGRGAPDRPPGPRARRRPPAPDEVDRAEQQEVVERFLPPSARATCRGSSTCSRRMSCWWPTAAAGPLRCCGPSPERRRVAGALSGFGRVAPDATLSPFVLNGAVGVRIDMAGRLDTAVSFVIEGGRISRIYAVRNPEKLGRLGEEAYLRR